MLEDAQTWLHLSVLSQALAHTLTTPQHDLLGLELHTVSTVLVRVSQDWGISQARSCGGCSPHLSTVLIRLQSAWTALLLTPFAKNKLAVPAPSGPCLCRNCGNQWEFFFYSPSLSSSAEQATSTNLTCHFPQEVLKGKDRTIFYTNCNGNGFVCNRSSGDLTCWFLRFWYIK